MGISILWQSQKVIIKFLEVPYYYLHFKNIFFMKTLKKINLRNAFDLLSDNQLKRIVGGYYNFGDIDSKCTDENSICRNDSCLIDALGTLVLGKCMHVVINGEGGCGCVAL